jgi:hypothetical protein
LPGYCSEPDRTKRNVLAGTSHACALIAVVRISGSAAVKSQTGCKVENQSVTVVYSLKSGRHREVARLVGLCNGLSQEWQLSGGSSWRDLSPTDKQ